MSTSPAVDLEMGGLGIRLSVSEPSLSAALAERYRHFPASGPVQMEAQIEYLGPGPVRLSPDPQLSFEPGCMRFNAPRYTGWVDERHGGSRLTLASDYPVEDIDYFVRLIAAVLAFRRGGMLFHAAGVVRRGRAHLFFGHSGSGKTTIARLSAGDTVLNDDLVLLLPEPGGWQAHATPFWNPTQTGPSRGEGQPLQGIEGHGEGAPRSAPIEGLYRLVQAEQVRLESMVPGQALAELVSNVPVIPLDPQSSLELLSTGRRLLGQVPAYRLHFLPDRTFWKVIDP